MDFSVRKNNFPRTFINKGVRRKKSKCVENGHSKLEITRKIKKILCFHCFLTILYNNKKKHFSVNRYLVHKRSSGHGDTITPWRVSSNQDNNYKTNVPINATLIGSVATIVITLGVISRSLFSESTTILAICSLAAGMFQIPLVLAFTIKHQNKTSKINPKPD